MDEVTPAPEGEAPDQPNATEADSTAEVESFTDINPSEAPEGEITPEWLQERHKQMQADYTRKTQGIAQTAQERQEELEFLEALRSDKDTQQAVFEELQKLLAEESEEGDESAGDEEGSELERQVQALQDREDQRQAETLTKSIVSHIEQLAKDATLELDEADLKEIFGRATAGDDVNNDTTANAFKAWHEREQAKQTKWQASYLKSKQPPTQQLPAGQSATDTPDLSKADERIKRMAAIMSAGSA